MHDQTEPIQPPNSSGVTRRRFLQVAGGSAAGTALVGAPVIVRGDEAKPVAREGIKSFAAGAASISLNVNGSTQNLTLPASTTLLEALRENIGLTGSKQVCDRGSCGACTVLVDGKSVNSCMTLAVDAIGSKITTIEGLSKDGQLDPVQKAFCEHDACQCGYCIPGFVVRSRALLDEQPNANREQIKQGLCGNICRCAAYIRIVEAVEAAAKGGKS